MKKTILAFITIISLLLCACGEPEAQNINENVQPQEHETVTTEEEEKVEEKTPVGTWTNVSWVQYSDDPEHYSVGDPRGLVITITDQQEIALRSHIDKVYFSEYSHMEFGSWKLDSDDEYSSHYIIYADGYEHGYFDFDKETGKMYLNWIGNKASYNVQMSFDDYSCKSDVIEE